MNNAINLQLILSSIRVYIILVALLVVVFVLEAQTAKAQVQIPMVTSLTPNKIMIQNPFHSSVDSKNNASATVSIPLSKGYVNGKIAFFIATDASDNKTASDITQSTGFKVNFAPILALIPQSSLGQGYEFLNGIKGHGPFGFQLPVANAIPSDKGYSPLFQLNFVKWNPNAIVRELKSVDEIMRAEKNNQLTINKTYIVINSPAVNKP